MVMVADVAYRVPTDYIYKIFFHNFSMNISLPDFEFAMFRGKRRLSRSLLNFLGVTKKIQI